MKLNSTILADVLAGQRAEQTDIAERTLFKAFQKDPRLPAAFWFLEYLSRSSGRVEDLVSGLNVKKANNWSDPVDDFDNMLLCLRGQAYRYCLAEVPDEIKAGIYKAMDNHAVKAKSALADTKVSKLIFRELDLAMRHKVPVPIIGDSRFGKTKAVSVWCEMRPGQARVVTVPDSNREWDFFAAHADAFGIEYTARTTLQKLKRAVQWVVQHSGLFICYDEAHFLVPVNYCLSTPPKRINWVRCHVIDKGIGCAFFATPQSLNQTLEKYAAKTKYNLEQWIGRLAPPLVLADYYDRDELMAVAKVHFPEFPEKLLALVCSRAMQSESYLKGMENAARYAAALAQECGRRAPALADVDAAIERMMPSKSAPVPTEATKRGRERDFKAVETPLQAAGDQTLAARLRRDSVDSDAEEFTGGRRDIRPRSTRELAPT